MKLILISIIIKFPLILIDIIPSDVFFYTATGQFILKGYIPYIDFNKINLIDNLIYTNVNHPNGPVNYILYSLIIILFGESTFAIKLPMLIAELVTIIVLFNISNILFNEKKAYIISIIYSLCPVSYFPMLLVGTDEIITGAFAILSIFYIFKEKHFLSGIFLSLGVLYKMYCVFFLIPIGLYYIFRKEKRSIFIFSISFALTSFSIIFPYIMIGFGDFIQWNFLQINRDITISFKTLSEGSAVYENIINLGFIQLSLFNIFQILIILVYTIMLIINFREITLKEMKIENDARKNRNQKFLLIKGCAFFTIILPLLSLSNNYRYFIWTLPFILLLIFKNTQLERVNYQKIIRISLWVNTIIVILIYIFHFVGFIFYLNFYFPFNVTHYFNSYLSLFAIIFLLWGVFYLKLFKNIIKSKYFIISSLFAGFANLSAYLALHIEVRTNFDNLRYILYFLSGILIAVSSIIFILITQSEKKIINESKNLF